MFSLNYYIKQVQECWDLVNDRYGASKCSAIELEYQNHIVGIITDLLEKNVLDINAPKPEILKLYSLAYDVAEKLCTDAVFYYDPQNFDVCAEMSFLGQGKILFKAIFDASNGGLYFGCSEWSPQYKEIFSRKTDSLQGTVLDLGEHGFADCLVMTINNLLI